VGAVQRLATVVIIGLTGLALVFMLYIADESNRQDAETKEQDEVAIERGIADYLQYCLVCHGPAGEGREEGTGRPGAPLGGSMTSTNQEGINNEGTPVAGGFAARTSVINDTIHRGRPQLGMPTWGSAYGGELTDDQINNLTFMIQHVDWNRVYNQAIELNGGYPTVPPQATAAPAPTTEPGAPAVAAQLEAYDIGWREKELTIGTGKQIIAITNTGTSLHDFTIDELNIKVDLPAGETTNVEIDAPVGTYTFYCSIPGHRAAGMEGTLTVKEGAGPPQASPSGAATPEVGGGEAAQPITVDLVDVAFNPPDITVKANTPTTVTLTNKGQSEHTFTVPDLGIDEHLAPAQTKEITINAAAGTYEITCSIPGHAAAGMVGTLTIE
jgi:uncharacterized cupredoxin-like copper-binding protein/mono/diheme cytochrome c family protein